MTNTNNERLTLTVAEVGELLGISRPKAYELAASRGFPAIHIGRRIIIPRAAFLTWLENAGGGGEPERFIVYD